jgi:hypothetical protein
VIVGRPVLLGVSGGIASYKACSIVRQLTDAGAVVDVVMTASATERRCGSGTRRSRTSTWDESPISSSLLRQPRTCWLVLRSGWRMTSSRQSCSRLRYRF